MIIDASRMRIITMDSSALQIGADTCRVGQLWDTLCGCACAESKTNLLHAVARPSQRSVSLPQHIEKRSGIYDRGGESYNGKPATRFARCHD